MTVLELLQCFGGVILGGLPIFIANRAGQEITRNPRGEYEENGFGFGIYIASVLQIAALVCAFKVGGI